MLLNRVVVEEHFSDGFVNFQGIFQVFTDLCSEKIVSKAETLESGKWALDHIVEFLSNVFRLDAAFGEVKFLDGKSLLVFKESSGDLDYTLFDWIPLENESL